MEKAENFRPMADNVLVRRDKADEKAGKIILPEAAKKEKGRGTVVAVGPGRRTEDGRVLPVDVKVGDRVLFAKYGATDVEIGKETLLLMREGNLLAVVD